MKKGSQTFFAFNIFALTGSLALAKLASILHSQSLRFKQMSTETPNWHFLHSIKLQSLKARL